MNSPPFLRPLLAGLAIIGLLVPWYFNVIYFLAGGSVMPDVFFRDAFANALTTAITLDVYLAAITFSLAVAADIHHPAGSRRWWAIAAAFGIGLSFALPAYLWWRLKQPSSTH
jgi:hypothetical protein